ncbi:MAG: 4,5:9,10-diseco-3-hydroxy-5,9,17-trioxoandrosta-1(10),2-diene-4-oate hydrolase [Alphaproteobacteria bacterium MarineAlpha4_Bin2]|nr:MAG: 4,5:9,10-diseco-3-hydroxy-5,9,17-trioxoandrosta-1(10),2-diene-4-oate hydrolase [Alphaproteobacteria bacterium MarineAlpha4_Bin2]
MPTFEEKGLTISYGEAGEGPDLVLLHAAGSTGAQWRGVISELGDRYHTLTPDLWGHGKTSFWPDPETLLHDRQAELVKRILDKEGIGTFDLVGHSYGGGTAIRFVLEYPEMVRSIVLIEPMVACFLRELGETEALSELEVIQDNFRIQLSAKGPEAAWREFLDFRNKPGTWAGYEEKTRKNFILRTPAQLANFNANSKNRTKLSDIVKIKQPTLVIRGVETSLYDIRMSEIVAENISGARFLILQGAGHMSPLTHPARIAEEIVSHIETPKISA